MRSLHRRRGDGPMTCAECPNPIHPERLAALPNAKTCSAACTRVRQLRSKAASSLKAHRKHRAALKNKPDNA